jgi:uncharacterized protein HemX
MARETHTSDQPVEAPPPGHTTVIHETRSGGGTGMVLAIVLLVAVIGAIYAFSQISATLQTRDNAVSEAANKVGDAAAKVDNPAERNETPPER